MESHPTAPSMQRRRPPEDFVRRNGHPPAVVWFTGLSGAGKSTLAHLLEDRLFHEGVYTYLLDADDIRSGLNVDLGYSEADRRENIRRFGEVARLFANAGLVVLAALISPFAEERGKVRSLFEPDQFIEVYVKCPLAVCEARDPKGLYRKARAGEIADFTGIDSPYQEPTAPELVIDTAALRPDAALERIYNYLQNRLTQRR